MKMTENEKIIGIETIRSRIAIFHKERITRLGGDPADIYYYQSAVLTPTQTLREWRAIPEGQEIISDYELDRILGA